MKIWLKLTFCFSAVVVLFIVINYFFTTQLNNIAEPLVNEMPAGTQELSDASYLNSLAQFIRYYDEVLTQSARNYAFTGDNKWKQRYKDNEPKLEKIIKEAIAKGKENEIKFFNSVDQSNLALVAMEYESIDDVDNGRKSEAVKILDGDIYQSQKDIYKNALEQYVVARGANYDEVLSASTKTIEGITKRTSNIINNGKKIVSASILTLAILIMLIVFFIRQSITGPIAKLMAAVSRISLGDFTAEIKINSHDEMADFADLLNKMTKDLRESKLEIEENNKNLENKVEETTRELRNTLAKTGKDQSEIDKQRRAILNILDDVSESETRLKISNDQLEKRSSELEYLKGLSDDLSGLFDIDETVKVLNKYLNMIIDAKAVMYLILNPADERSFLFKTFLKNEASESFVRDLKERFLSLLKNQRNETIGTSIKIIENINPQIFGARLNNNADAICESEAFYPLIIGESKYGAIYISFAGKDNHEKDNEKLLSAMITSFSFFVSHLYSLISTHHSKTISLVESLSDGVIMFNNQKNIVLVNPAFARYTGLTIKDINLDDFYASFADTNINGMVNLALNEDRMSHISEIKINSRFYEIFITPVKENQTKVVGGAIIMHDITQIKEISQMKTEFVSVASHQLRTPLTAIKLFTEMLLKGDVGKLMKDQEEYLSNINQSTDRMVRLVNDLLNVTRIESGRLTVDPQPTDIAGFAKKIIDEARPIADIKKVKINFSSVKKKLPNIPLDQNLVRQVIHNLVMNAIRYSPAGKGKVNVIIKENTGDKVLLSVSDNGIGIPEPVKKRIFEKFFRADNAIKIETEGTGLGLYVCRMIVESSGGKIWFESTEGKGTTFYFTLPIAGMKKKEGERGLVIS